MADNDRPRDRPRTRGDKPKPHVDGLEMVRWTELLEKGERYEIIKTSKKICCDFHPCDHHAIVEIVDINLCETHYQLMIFFDYLSLRTGSKFNLRRIEYQEEKK